MIFMYFLQLFLMKGLGGEGDKNKVNKFYGITARNFKGNYT